MRSLHVAEASTGWLDSAWAAPPPPWPTVMVPSSTEEGNHWCRYRVGFMSSWLESKVMATMMFHSAIDLGNSLVLVGCHEIHPRLDRGSPSNQHSFF